MGIYACVRELLNATPFQQACEPLSDFILERATGMVGCACLFWSVGWFGKWKSNMGFFGVTFDVNTKIEKTHNECFFREIYGVLTDVLGLLNRTLNKVMLSWFSIAKQSSIWQKPTRPRDKYIIFRISMVNIFNSFIKNNSIVTLSRTRIKLLVYCQNFNRMRVAAKILTKF